MGYAVHDSSRLSLIWMAKAFEHSLMSVLIVVELY